MSQHKQGVTIFQKMLFSGVCSLTFLMLLGGVGYWQAKSLMQQLNHSTNVEVPAIRNSLLMDMSHDAVNAIVLGAEVAADLNDQAGLKELQGELKGQQENFEQYLKEIGDLPLRPGTKKKIDEMHQLLLLYLQAAQDCLDEAMKGKSPELFKKAAEFSVLFKQLVVGLEDLSSAIEADTKATQSAGASVLNSIAWTTASTSLISGVLTLFLILSLVRSLSQLFHKISESSQELKSANSQLTENSGELSGSASRTASSLEETSAALEQLGSTMTKNGERAHQVAELSETAQQTAEAGEEKIDRIIGTIEAVAKSSATMQEITETMDDLAFQTNLLALNAAIEAARAGAEGRGFAIVAEAVRGLAEKSSQAAKSISVQIQQSVSIIEKGNALAGEGREALKQIVKATNAMRDLNSKLADSHQEQVNSLHEIRAAITLIDEDAQRNASVADSLSSTARDVSGNAEQLQVLVSEAQQELGAGRSRAAA